MEITIHSNIDSVVAASRKLEGLLPGRVEQFGLVAAARVARDEALRNTWFVDRTGDLKRSIKVGGRRRTFGVTARGRKRTFLFATLKIGQGLTYYGPFLELGTKHIKARAPLRRATEKTAAQQLQVGGAVMRTKFIQLARQLNRGTLSAANKRLSGL